MLGTHRQCYLVTQWYPLPHLHPILCRVVIVSVIEFPSQLYNRGKDICSVSKAHVTVTRSLLGVNITSLRLALSLITHHYQEETCIAKAKSSAQTISQKTERKQWIRTQQRKDFTLEASSAPTVDLWREYRCFHFCPTHASVSCFEEMPER